MMGGIFTNTTNGGGSGARGIHRTNRLLAEDDVTCDTDRSPIVDVGNKDKKEKNSFYLLDTIHSPADMKHLTMEELEDLAHQVRWKMLSCVSQTGGHLSSSLGANEIAVALHYVYDAPRDDIVWDCSHQAYSHKILTGRKDLHKLKQEGGVSGMTKRSESLYDVFTGGHASIGISAGQGMSIANHMFGNDNKNNNGKKTKKKHVVTVIGDGAMTGGMVYEAMNSAGYHKTRMVVVLNDNGQVSLPTGLPTAAATTASATTCSACTDHTKPVSELSSSLQDDDDEKRGAFFRALGWDYVGPIDGHDLPTLVSTFQGLRDQEDEKDSRVVPVVVHVKTIKGYGYEPALKAADLMHGVGKFNLETGEQYKTETPAPTFTSIFANALVDAATRDPKIVGITAAMPAGTGMDIYGKHFPERTFDVGIAEQHAVTMAAGMACNGAKPFVCAYSGFLQRGFEYVKR